MSSESSASLAGGEGEAPGRAVELLGRVGLVSYGIVHVVLGVLAANLAVSGGRGQADQQGAVASLAARPFGSLLIGVVVVGLLACAVWQGTAAVTGFRTRPRWERIRRRVGAGAYALGMLGVAALGVQLLVTGSAGSSGSGSQQMAADLLALPAGRGLVVGIGVAVLVVAGATAWTGVSRGFLDDLDESRVPRSLHGAVVAAGVAGYVTRGVAFAIVGVLFLVAAWRTDPTRAGGLDAALRVLARQPAGVTLLVAVALGFIAFGVYTVAEAHARAV